MTYVKLFFPTHWGVNEAKEEVNKAWNVRKHFWCELHFLNGGL